MEEDDDTGGSFVFILGNSRHIAEVCIQHEILIHWVPSALYD